jgi:hypothetical protein
MASGLRRKERRERKKGMAWRMVRRTRWPR